MWKFFTTIFLTVLGFVGIKSTPLDDYVTKEDPHSTFKLLEKIRGDGYTLHIFNLTSQKWLDETMVTSPIWWHYFTIIIPDNMDYRDVAYIWVDQGTNNDGMPTLADASLKMVTSLALGSKTACAIIKQVPNQPIQFKDDPEQKERYDQAAMAWTWREYLKDTSKPEILLQLPMTKAVVVAMDSIYSYVKYITGYVVNRFVIGGASMGGWTTWTTAAVSDPRVIAMTPCVMDLVNIRKNLHHHYRSLGGWSWAFGDFYHLNVTDHVDNPHFSKMEDVIDPLTYSDRYTMPKLIITTTGDEFFLPDDSHYYYNQMIGPKYLRIIPNADHSLVGHMTSLLSTIQSFYTHVLEKAELPTITWELSQTDKGGKIEMQTSKKPSSVTLFHARTVDGRRRDFRLLAKDPSTGKLIPQPVVWCPGQATEISETKYQAEVENPSIGWAAFFIQVTFDGVKNSTLEFTTEVNVVPDIFPFPDCSGASCHGDLV